MIRISQIDDNLGIYKENTVILLGIGHGTKELLDLIHYHEIYVDYICDNNEDNWGKKLEGIPVISPPHMQQLAQSENSQNSARGEIVVQIAINNINNVIEEQLKSIGINFVVSFYECYNILNYLRKTQIIKLSHNYKYDIKNIEILDEYNKKMEFKNHIIHSLNKEILVLCSAQKTGNTTVETTCRKNNINVFGSFHRTDIIDLDLLYNIKNKVKLVTAIREPISQNISAMYEQITSFITCERKWIIDLIENEWLKYGGDINEVFQIWLNNYGSSNIDNNKPSTLDIECFFNSYKENILDLSAYPFDKEKGYTIIKEGNIEVFAYQLERMNDVVNEMSNWIGQTPFNEWVKGNEASSKWIANSYRQALKEINFSQEYFDHSYNEHWIQHFYSQEDIEKFKERWRPHIKE